MGTTSTILTFWEVVSMFLPHLIVAGALLAQLGISCFGYWASGRRAKDNREIAADTITTALVFTLLIWGGFFSAPVELLNATWQAKIY